MGGRITGVAVVESRPTTMYIAAASGGVWKTTNNGTTWSCVFEGGSTASIVDVAVAPSNPDVVWVGTGESNPRNSVTWGDGVYRSTDTGKTWQNMGCRDGAHRPPRHSAEEPELSMLRPARLGRRRDRGL